MMRMALHDAGEIEQAVASPDETHCQNIPISVMDSMEGADWANRLNLQAKWSNKEKGWQVGVEWRNTPFGVGVFAAQDIAEGTILRIGTNGFNLVQFQSVVDIESFCNDGKDETEYHARLHYVSDYLWGYSYKNTDAREYDLEPLGDKESIEDRFFGMWIPGNGLNHNSSPNTVYRTRKGGTKSGIVLVALVDITRGEELYDDYRRHGRAPQWLLEFSSAKQISLNFSECNDFVEPTSC
jgi:SET domain